MRRADGARAFRFGVEARKVRRCRLLHQRIDRTAILESRRPQNDLLRFHDWTLEPWDQRINAELELFPFCPECARREFVRVRARRSCFRVIASDDLRECELGADERRHG